MQITKQADYAMRAVMFLARLPQNQKAPTSIIAEEQHIPPSFLAKIISQLSIAGLLHTARGARGGVSLARPAADISVLDVIEAIDGPVALNECTINPATCVLVDDCPMHAIWVDTRDELLTRLRGISFSRFADNTPSL